VILEVEFVSLHGQMHFFIYKSTSTLTGLLTYKYE